MNPTRSQDQAWWKKAVIYQVYPRSFYDANNDGIGDLQGITEKLDYLNDGKGGGLGIDVVWISPFFTSPMADFGYDVSDYCDIDPIFGTLNDYKNLVNQAHKRGIKILIDLVLNHTSDQHPWFKESRSNLNSDRADWYVWADPKPDGAPPNNWLSIFGGPAWTFCEKRQQYYFHNFLKEQPDLNWYNPDVKAAIKDVVRFWMDLGTDGFRLDTANFYAYDRELRDNPLNPEGIKTVEDTSFNPYYDYDTIYSKDRPDNIDFITFLRTLFDQGQEITSIGEIGGIQDLEKVIESAAEHSKGNDRLHMAYTFSLLNQRADIRHINQVISITEEKMANGWPCWSLGNHDITRIKTRYGCLGDKEGLEQTFLLFLLCIRGTPVLYYGDEISMQDVEIKKKELQDPYGKQFWPEFKGRDGCRTPFAWDRDKPNQGFNQGASAWLPTRSRTSLNDQLKNKNSTYYIIREMLQIRKIFPALSMGSFRQIYINDACFVFEREYKNQRLIIGMNISVSSHDIKLEDKINGLKNIPIFAFTRNGMAGSQTLHLPAMGFYIGECS